MCGGFFSCSWEEMLIKIWLQATNCVSGQLSPKKPPRSEEKGLTHWSWKELSGKWSPWPDYIYYTYICSVLNYICGKNVSAKHLGWVRIFPGRRWWTLDNPESEGFQLILVARHSRRECKKKSGESFHNSMFAKEPSEWFCTHCVISHRVCNLYTVMIQMMTSKTLKPF